MYYKQSRYNHDTRFLRTTLIVELHDLLKKDCQVINDHVIGYFIFDDNNLYKYDNPNLIRNHGNVKTDHSLHLDFSKSVVACTTLSTSVSDNNLPAKKRKVPEKENNLPNNKKNNHQEKNIMNLIKTILPIKDKQSKQHQTKKDNSSLKKNN